MEEPVNRMGAELNLEVRSEGMAAEGMANLMKVVAATQRDALVGANTLARVRLQPPPPRHITQRLLARLPRLRFVLPTLAAVGACAVWWGTQPAPLTFVVGAGHVDAAEVGDDRPSGDRRTGETNLVAGASVGDQLEAAASSRLPIAFSDGSSVDLDRSARARITAVDSRGATVQLIRGRADVSVNHRRNTRWQLKAGPFDVIVTGTRFSIDWNDKSEALTVVMSEGAVEIRGQQLVGNGPVVVTAGQRFRATVRESRWTLAASSQPELAPIPSDNAAVGGVAATAGEPGVASPGEAAPSPDATAPTPMPSNARGSAGAGRSWQALARAGRYEEALQTAERTGFARACRRLGAADLVQLGDVARLARNPSRAEQAYQSARRRFPGSDRPVFALGLVAFEQRRDYRAAGKWFDTYVRHYPRGPLAREAVGREMESWHRAGDAGRARRAARNYLTQAPTGPYAPLARQIVSP